MTDKNLRKALLKQLNCSPQALSQRAKRIKKKNPMTTEEATYVIAHNEGILIDKYLDKDTVANIRRIVQQNTSQTAIDLSSKQKPRKKAVSGMEQRVIEIAKEFKFSDPILQDKKMIEAKEMAAIYPLLYILENSIREVIDKVMISKYGDGWWASHAPRGLREAVEKRMADEEKHPWHQRRGARPIDYLYLVQLPALIRKVEKEVVPNVIPSYEWLNQLIEEVYKSRCVICHMNPLDKDSIDSVKLRFKQWQKQIKSKKSLIEASGSQRS
jgi:hypothetical protein